MTFNIPSTRRRALLALAAAGLAMGRAAPTRAQSAKPPLRMVVGFAAGGNVDWVARILSEKLRAPLGRTLLVDNRPGAGSRVAMVELKRQPADGSVLAVTVDAPFTMYPHTVAKLEFDAVKDFSPIVRVATFDYAMAVAASHPAHNLKEYVAWAAANANEAAYGSPGSGSGPSFIGDLIRRTFKLERLADVPYRSGAAANNDVLGRQISAAIGVLPDMLELHRAGKLRIIAVGGAKRSPLLPDVPTLRESGVDFEADISVSLYGPAGLPAATTNTISTAVAGVMNDAEVRAQLVGHGLTPAVLGSADLLELQTKDSSTWEALVKASGYAPQ